MGVAGVEEPFAILPDIASLLLEESADKALNFLDAMYTQEFGGKFISYDMEKWIFRVPHFNR